MTTTTERHPLDTQNLIGAIDEFPKQFAESLDLAYNFHVEGEFDHIIWAGVGGSSWPGLLLNDYLDQEAHVHIWNTYDLPTWATANSLIICCSYSGNSEEAVSSYHAAKALGATLVVIASGGQLVELAIREQTPFIQLTGGIQPRYASGYPFGVGLALLQNSELISDHSEDLQNLSSNLPNLIDKERCQILARKLRDKQLFLYGPHELGSAIYVSKIKFNENTKIHATTNVFPELNHNEMSGFLDKNIDANVLLFESATQHARITKRMRLFQKLLEEKNVTVIPYKLKATTKLEQSFEIIMVADYLSYYLALYYEFDPTLVEFQESFKVLLKS